MNTYILAYVSEGMKLEEDIWYVVRAEDRPLAYGKLWDYLVKEDPEWSYIEQGVEYFCETYEVMFEFEGPMLSHTVGLNVCEVE